MVSSQIDLDKAEVAATNAGYYAGATKRFATDVAKRLQVLMSVYDSMYQTIDHVGQILVKDLIRGKVHYFVLFVCWPAAPFPMATMTQM